MPHKKASLPKKAAIIPHRTWSSHKSQYAQWTWPQRFKEGPEATWSSFTVFPMLQQNLATVTATQLQYIIIQTVSETFMTESKLLMMPFIPVCQWWEPRARQSLSHTEPRVLQVAYTTILVSTHELSESTTTWTFSSFMITYWRSLVKWSSFGVLRGHSWKSSFFCRDICLLQRWVAGCGVRFYYDEHISKAYLFGSSWFSHRTNDRSMSA
jgi:hypothetical protein